MASIINVVQFPCLNELAFRGDGTSGINTLYDDDENEPSGLFLRLLEYTLKKDEKLRALSTNRFLKTHPTHLQGFKMS